MQQTYEYVLNSNFRLGWMDRDDKLVSNIYSAWTKEETETSLLLKNLKKVSEKSKFNINIDNFDRCIVNLSVVIIILIIHILECYIMQI